MDDTKNQITSKQLNTPENQHELKHGGLQDDFCTFGMVLCSNLSFQGMYIPCLLLFATILATNLLPGIDKDIQETEKKCQPNNVQSQNPHMRWKNLWVYCL